jgi:hypothetical protein
MPRKSRATLERNARWLCLHRVYQYSLPALAQAWFGDADRHKDVRVGIERAERILTLSDT